MSEKKYIVYGGRGGNKTYLAIQNLLAKGITPEQVNMQIFVTDDFKKAFEKEYNKRFKTPSRHNV